jgi:hypothetical protein
VRGKSRAVLLALAVVALAPSFAAAQYAPKWHVGDWWIVKVWESDMIGGKRWLCDRYDVLRVEESGGADCFVIQHRIGDTAASRDGVRDVYYVRTTDYRIVRKVEYLHQAGKPLGPRVFNCPEGMYGPTPFHPRLPLFPLDSVSTQDSGFHDCHTAMSWASLRQFSGPADSALLSRHLVEPNPSGGCPVQLRGGTVFSVLSEMGVRRDSITMPSVYSLQLWSRDYPWRLYEEQGQYVPDGTRTPRSQSWLVACGHSGLR